MLFGLLGKHAPRTATGPADARTASREALLGQAREFLASRRMAAAEVVLDTLIERFPADAEVRNQLGVLYYSRGEFADAEVVFREASTLAPRYASALANLGQSLQVRGGFAEARPLFESALRIEPGHPQARFNLAVSCYALGDTSRAIAICRELIADAPHDASAHIALGESLLRVEQFDEGWREYEWRLREPDYQSFFRHYEEPMWDGFEHAGERLLIWPEQGFGDTLQFMRLAPVVAARFPRMQVMLEVPAAIYRLAQSSLSGPANLSLAESGKPVPSFNRHVSIMSLPALLRCRLTENPVSGPYLRPAAALVAGWRARVDIACANHAARKVGLVWAGNRREQLDAAGKAVDTRRSLAADMVAGFTRVPGCEFFSLQVGPRSAELAAHGVSIHDFTAGLKDFADTAALIEVMDLVITVDTAVAHLAGAMGKPVWMLSRHDCCWRWGTQRADIPWYPSVRPYYQPTPGVWEPVLRQVAHDLRQFA